MDDEGGFNGAVNRGPSAFVSFLLELNNALGVDVRSFLSQRHTETDREKQGA
jgi:hypothetical protein